MLGGQSLRLALILNFLNTLAKRWHLTESGHGHRCGWPSSLQVLAAPVFHSANLAPSAARHDKVALVQRAVLNQHAHHGATPLLKVRLNHQALSLNVIVGFQLLHVGHEQHRVEQLVNALPRHGRDFHHNSVATPLLWVEAIVARKLRTH